MKNIYFFLLFLIAGCSSSGDKVYSQSLKPKKCEYTRAALEFNSENIRLLVSRVDACRDLYLSTLVDNAEVFSPNENNLSQAQALVKKLISLGSQHNPDLWVGAAVGRYRELKNSKQYIERLSIDNNIPIQIITEAEEAILGFYSVMNSSKIDKDKLVVWNVADESQQIISYKGFRKFDVYNSKLGSVTFKNYIIKRITKKNFQNKLSSYHFGLAENYARQTATKNMKSAFQEKVSTSEEIYAIGDVFNKDVFSLINPLVPTLELDALENYVKNAKHESDYISDLALIIGYMKALNIKAVKLINQDIALGLVLNANYWGPLK